MGHLTGNEYYLDHVVEVAKSIVLAIHKAPQITGKTKIEAEGRGYFAIFIDCEGNKVGLYGED